MDNQNIFKQFFRAVFHELFRKKNSYNLLASLALIIVILIGYYWDELYTSTATISVAQKTFVSSPTDFQFVKSELKKLVNQFNTPDFRKRVIKALDDDQQIGTREQNHIDALKQYSKIFLEDDMLLHISFDSKSPHEAQRVLSETVAVLIDRTMPTARLEKLKNEYRVLSEDESRQRDKLRQKEEQLIELRFAIGNPDADRARKRVASIKETLQDAEININATNAKIDRIRLQLAKEEEYQSVNQQLKSLKTQKTELETRLEESKEVYLSSDPEMVSLQQELDNINIELSKFARNGAMYPDNLEPNESLYQQLRAQLTLSEVELQGFQTRYDSLRNVLQDELNNASAGETQTREIERINKEHGVLNDNFKTLIEQKNENMAAQKNIEEVTPSFIVLKRPTLPEKYTGIGLIEFLIMGPLVALGLPLAIASIVVFADSRIRTSRQLKNIIPAEVPILAVIPHYNSPITLRIFHKAIIGLIAWGTLVFSVYFFIGVIGLKG